MLARARFTIFEGTINAVGVYAETGLVSAGRHKTVPLLWKDMSGMAFLATVTDWDGTTSPICDVRIVHSPNGIDNFQLGAFANISDDGAYLLTPEGLVTQLIFNKLAIHIAELTNVTELTLKVEALCAQV